jgi:hypothetical protein
VTRLLVALYFLETGLLLVVAPWTDWWRRNYFAEIWPAVRSFLDSDAAVVVVVAAGVVTAIVGVGDLHVLLFRRWRARVPAADPTREL